MIYTLLNRLLNDCPFQSTVAEFNLKTPLSMIQVGRVHGMDRKLTFLVFEKGSEHPAVILKVTRSPDYRQKLQREYDRLVDASSLSTIRQTIPKPLGIFEANGYLVMAESFVPGIPLSVLLRRRERTKPAQVEEDLACAELWLNEFHHSEVSDHINWNAAGLHYEMNCVPNDTCDPFFTGEILQTARHFDGFAFLLKPSHGDFWPGNLLIHGRSISVVDWENFQPKAWPLRDAFLFLTAYARSYPWKSWKLLPRADAFRKAFLENNWFSKIMKGYMHRSLMQMKIPDEAAHLLFFHFLLTMAREERETRGVAQGQWHEYLRTYQCSGKNSIFKEMA